MHEAIFSDKGFAGGFSTIDLAKALIDEGFHPMTMYFPLVVHGAMLVEPTETECKASLDQFIAALRSIAERARAGDQSLKAAPVHAPRRRLDETLAARKPVLAYREPAPDAAEAPSRTKSAAAEPWMTALIAVVALVCRAQRSGRAAGAGLQCRQPRRCSSAVRLPASATWAIVGIFDPLADPRATRHFAEHAPIGRLLLAADSWRLLGFEPVWTALSTRSTCSRPVDRQDADRQ